MLEERHPKPPLDSPESFRKLRNACLLFVAFFVCALASGLGFEITFAAALLIEGAFWHWASEP